MQKGGILIHCNNNLLTGYWHQVRSYGTKNMAVSVLFSRLKEFNASGCSRAEYAPLPLSNVDMIWTYPGHGPQTLGNSDPYEIRLYRNLDYWNTPIMEVTTIIAMTPTIHNYHHDP